MTINNKKTSTQQAFKAAAASICLSALLAGCGLPSLGSPASSTSISGEQSAIPGNVVTIDQKDYDEAAAQFKDYMNGGYDASLKSVNECLVDPKPFDEKANFLVSTISWWNDRLHGGKNSAKDGRLTSYDILGEIDYFLGQNLTYDPAKLDLPLEKSGAYAPLKAMQKGTGICVDYCGLGKFIADFCGVDCHILFLTDKEKGGGHTVLLSTIEGKSYIYGEGQGVSTAQDYFAGKLQYEPLMTLDKGQDGKWSFQKLTLAEQASLVGRPVKNGSASPSPSPKP